MTTPKNHDNVTPHERIYGRRETDELSVRPMILAIFLVVALVAATGMIGGTLDKLDEKRERQAVEVATVVGIVAHKILTSCGL